MACTIDFRNLDEGFGGKTYKRKRAAAAADASNDITMDIDENPSSKRHAISSSDDPNKPAFGNPTYDGVIAGKVSGRKWKTVRKSRASAREVSLRRTTHEERERQKEIKRAFRERKNELKEEIRRNKVEKRRLKEEREKRKKENVLRSGTKFQKITNPKTLKKISKSKDRKLLKLVNDDLVNNGKRK